MRVDVPRPAAAATGHAVHGAVEADELRVRHTKTQPPRRPKEEHAQDRLVGKPLPQPGGDAAVGLDLAQLLLQVEVVGESGGREIDGQ